MKLARKLTLAFVVGMSAVFAVSAWVSVRRASTFAEKAMERDAHLTGRALALSVAKSWRQDGQAAALKMIDDASEEEGAVRVRWVWLNAPEEDPYAPRAPKSVLGPVALGEEVSYRDYAHGEPVLRTYIPAAIERGRPGAIEISATTASEKLYVHNTIRNAIITTLVMAGVVALMAIILGGWFVGRPIRALVVQARRVGAGDLSGRLHLKQRDEIRELADEMNAMTERLAQSKSDVEGATTAKIAAIEQLRHADRLTTVGKLASGIAHELGTPLNVVSGRARMIGAGDMTHDEIVECSGIIVEQTKRMTTIIRQLLDFARRRGAHKSPENVPQLARNTIFLLAPIADKRGVRLVVEPDGDDQDHRLVAEVDAGQLQQALTNLVVNGIQATSRPGGGQITVAIERRRARPPADHPGAEGEYLRIRVTDQGDGMPRETMAHIFEPFFTTKAVGDGTGLGLSVTYGIIQEHGGWIAVDSEVGKGTTFAVFLPVTAADGVPYVPGDTTESGSYEVPV